MERLGCPAYNLESYVDESTPIQKKDLILSYKKEGLVLMNLYQQIKDSIYFTIFFQR